MNARATPEVRVGADIGGTFTDVVLIADDLTLAEKVLTTPQEPAQGVIEGVSKALSRAGLQFADLSVLVHGTTLVTNALIERKGVKVALLCTAGFRDVIEIGNADRYDMYDLFLLKPEPLVPRELRLPIRERLLADGAIATPLDEAGVLAAAAIIREQGVKAVAIAFLHSYRNPVHERRAAEILRAEVPDLYISLSSEVAPEIREYERTSTTICNVYVQPIVERYLADLERSLSGRKFAGQLLIMISTGGTCTVETASRFPIRILESGPAAGVLAASYHSRSANLPHLIAFDMGGTTAKGSLVQDALPTITSDFEVARVYRLKRGSGMPVRVPVVDMIEIGAGGGSIARADRMGLLKVGPDSAGSEPGPACYGLGGTQPTVTDADLVLGYLDPEFFLGGGMKLDVKAARAAIADLGAKLGLTIDATAVGIHRVVNEAMAAALRMHALERGKDVRDYALFAFGGAGPVHACNLATILGVSLVISPLGAGVASAHGMLSAPLAFELVRSYSSRLDRIDWAYLNALLDAMADEGRLLLSRSGVGPGEVSIERSCDMRYAGQTSEIRVPLPEVVLGPETVSEITRRFDVEYRRLFERLRGAMAIEAVTWRVTASGPVPVMPAHKPGHVRAVQAPQPKKHRPIFLFTQDRFAEAPVYDRHVLGAGASVAGPCVIEERESTTVVDAGYAVSVDARRNLLVRRESA